MRLVLLGPPGSGKGTQAKALSNDFGILHVSTGDLLREINPASKLGSKIGSFMKKGELVPDSIVMKIVTKKISKESPRKKGFILDGFPRTKNQAQMLEMALDKKGMRLDLVINLSVSLDTIIKRLSARRVCWGCGAIFHLVNMPPRKSGICDYCGDRLYQRDDDKPVTIKKRLKVYEDQTRSLIDYYKDNASLVTINADSKANKVYRLILRCLKARGLIKG
jgi:adenylate kinase